MSFFSADLHPGPPTMISLMLSGTSFWLTSCSFCISHELSAIQRPRSNDVWLDMTLYGTLLSPTYLVHTYSPYLSSTVILNTSFPLVFFAISVPWVFISYSRYPYSLSISVCSIRPNLLSISVCLRYSLRLSISVAYWLLMYHFLALSYISFPTLKNCLGLSQSIQMMRPE